MIGEKINEEFEAWFSKNYPIGNLERTAEECLRKMLALQAWEASRAAIEVALPFSLDPYDPDTAWANQGFIKSITAAGLKIKQ